MRSREEELAASIPVIEGLAAPGRGPISIDTSKARRGRGRARRRRRDRQRRHRAAAIRRWRRSAPSAARADPDAHAGRPADDAGRPRYDDVVDDVKCLSRRADGAGGRRGVDEERIWSIPGSASARPSSTTSSCSRGSASCATSVARSSSAPRARASSASSPAPRSTDRLGGTIASCVLAFARGADVLRVHDVAPVREALMVAEAILGGWQGTGYGPRTSMSAAGEDIRIELRGLEAVGPHGVTAEEREAGRRIALDISLTVSGSAAVTTDELEDTVDYGAVARLAVELVEGRSCHTIERSSRADRRRDHRPLPCRGARGPSGQAAGADGADDRRGGRDHPSRGRGERPGEPACSGVSGTFGLWFAAKAQEHQRVNVPQSLL